MKKKKRVVSARPTPRNLTPHPRSGEEARATPTRAVREKYGLSPPLLAQLFGVAGATLTQWEKTGKLPKGARPKVAKVANLLKQLSRVMPKADLAAWLTRPNDACASAGGATPAELMAKGQYEKIEAMIYFFESGVAY
jgi:hypothetical protein